MIRTAVTLGWGWGGGGLEVLQKGGRFLVAQEGRLNKRENREEPHSPSRSELAKLNNEWEFRISGVVSLVGLGIEQESPQIERLSRTTIDRREDALVLQSVSVMEMEKSGGVRGGRRGGKERVSRFVRHIDGRAASPAAAAQPRGRITAVS